MGGGAEGLACQTKPSVALCDKQVLCTGINNDCLIRNILISCSDLQANTIIAIII